MHWSLRPNPIRAKEVFLIHFSSSRQCVKDRVSGCLPHVSSRAIFTPDIRALGSALGCLQATLPIPHGRRLSIYQAEVWGEDKGSSGEPCDPLAEGRGECVSPNGCSGTGKQERKDWF